MKHDRSIQLFNEASYIFPGGVNSPVRAFKSVGGAPPFITRAQGSRVIDADGNTYIDYVGSWGPAILGHADPRILDELKRVMLDGLSFGAPTAKETELACLVQKLVPSVELLRFVSSGTEATMSAIRVARGFTGKPGVIKFDGCYHGHADYLLVRAGSGAQTLGIPDSAGVPSEFTRHTHVATYNDIGSVEKILAAQNDIACLIVEPIIGNMGCIPPEPAFLKALRDVCTQHQVVLIFDEVMTGFRVAAGGAQALYGITPDLTCFGKIIGGGLPVGAYGGRRDIMQCVAPLGAVYQAGTLSGNPLAMTCGLTTLKILQDDAIYQNLESLGQLLQSGCEDIAKKQGVALQFNRVGSMFSFFFSNKPVRDGASAREADVARFKKVFHQLLDAGIYLAPSAFEAGFISAAHTEADIDQTLLAFETALRA